MQKDYLRKCENVGQKEEANDITKRLYKRKLKYNI